MRVFISSDSADTFFVDNALEAIRTKGEEIRNAIGIEIQTIYPPRQTTTGMTVEDKIAQIKDSHLVLMNVTPRIVSGEYVVNSGVLIEYGIVLGLHIVENLCILCNQTIDRARLSPIFHGHDIQQFPQADNGVQLRETTKTILSNHVARIVERSRRLARSDRILQDFVEMQVRSADNAS